MKFLFAALVMLSSAHLYAVTPADVTVKIRSYPCDLQSPVFEGSGFLLKHDHQAYVVTSEHVLLHPERNTCYTIENPLLGLIPAKFLMSDWANGLGLLGLEIQLNQGAFVHLSDLMNSHVGDQSNAITAGSPFGMSQILVHDGGKILSKSSPRHFLPSLTHVTELIHAHGEFGMSGGPVFDASASKVIGMLSHQHLKLEAGGRTRIGMGNSSGGSEIQNHLLLIPSHIIKEWLLSYFAKSIRPSLVRHGKDQLSGRNIVYSNGFAFEAIPTDAICQKDSISSTGPIGGSDPSGIGGSDPSGIGGVENHQGKGIMVRVSLSPSPQSTSWFLPQRQPWIDSINRQLLLNSQINISELVYRSGQKFEKLCLRSLEGFFRKLSSPSISPIAVITGGARPVDEAIELENLRALNTEANVLAEGLNSDGLELEARALIEQIKHTSTLLASSEWEVIRDDDLERLINLEGKHREGWKILLNQSFDDSVRILRLLREIRVHMARIRL